MKTFNRIFKAISNTIFNRGCVLVELSVQVSYLKLRYEAYEQLYSCLNGNTHLNNAAHVLRVFLAEETKKLILKYL